MSDTAIEGWSIAETECTDGSILYDVVGANDCVRVVFGCNNKKHAERLLSELNFISCCSAEEI